MSGAPDSRLALDFCGMQFATPLVNQFLRFGASPRAAQTLVLGAKVKALLAGRAAVAADDVKAVALPALRHRVLMNFEAEAQVRGADEIVTNILETVPASSPDSAGAR